MNKLANAKRLTAEIAKGLASNGYDVKVDRLNDYATEITVEGRYKIGVTVSAGYPVVYNYLTGNSYGGDEYVTMNSMAAAMSQIMKNAIFSLLVKKPDEKPEGRTITVTLHPEDEEEEKTITYAGVKTYGFVAGKTAKMIENHTDGSCIDKNHEYLVVVFRDLTETVFRRSSVVEVKEGNRIMVNGWDEDEPTADAKTAAAEEPQPTPEEADREVIYIDFKPEQDYEEERPPHAAFEQLRRDSIEPPKIWSCKALKVQEILQKIYEGKTKTSGERLDAYYNHCNNLILASRIFLPECMYRYLERKLSNELVIAGVCPAVIEEAFGYKKTRRKWYWKL